MQRDSSDLKTVGVMFEGLRASLQARAPIPAKFQCVKCGFALVKNIRHFRVWAATYRPDLARHIAHPLRLDSVVLCQCDGDAQERAKAVTQKTLINDANFPAHDDEKGPLTWDNFDAARAGVPEMFEAVHTWALGQGPRCLVLVGNNGCGKSHTVEAIGRQLLEEGHSVRYEEAIGLLDNLRHTYNQYQEEDDIFSVLRWYQGFRYLIIDEIGLGKSTPWGVGYLTNIINSRIAAGSPVLLCTNKVSADELIEDGWGFALASRMYDMDSGQVRVIMCEADDYRNPVREV